MTLAHVVSGGSGSGPPLPCSYSGCQLPSIKNCPLCRVHWDEHLKKTRRTFPPPGERKPPSPVPPKKPAPFQTTTARLLPEPDPAGNRLVREVMRKTAPGTRSAPSVPKNATSSPLQTAAPILSPPDSLAHQEGPERKRRRIEDRPEAETRRQPRDGRAHSAGAPNGNSFRDTTGSSRSGHSSQTLSSQSFYGSRHTPSDTTGSNGQKNGDPGTAGSGGEQDRPAAPVAPMGPVETPTPAPSTAPSMTPAATPAGAESTAPPAEPEPKAPRLQFNPSLTSWFYGSMSKDYLGPNSRASVPKESASANSTSQEPLVLSMPLAMNASESGARGMQRGKSMPAREQERSRLPAKPDPPPLDSFIYGQESTQLPPPRGVTLAPRPDPPKPRDEPFFAYLDPRVHWCRPHSDSWYQQKQKEIRARGDRKANFGMAARRMAEQRQAEQRQADRGLPEPGITTAVPLRTRLTSIATRKSTQGRGGRSAANAAALVRIQKTFDAWDNALWERDKEATRKEEAEKGRTRAAREKPRPNSTVQPSGSRR